MVWSTGTRLGSRTSGQITEYLLGNNLYESQAWPEVEGEDHGEACQGNHSADEPLQAERDGRNVGAYGEDKEEAGHNLAVMVDLHCQLD